MIEHKWTLLLLFVSVISALAAAQTNGSPKSIQTQSDQLPTTQTQTQPPSDLSQAAQRAKAERERQRAQRSTNSEAVNEMAKLLSEESEHVPSEAPVGYRYYNFKEGDYSVLVPADAEVQGRNSYGLELMSSDAIGSRTVVLLGEPIPAQGDTSVHILRNAAEQYFPGCKLGISGLAAPVNGHSAASAGFSMCPLHREVMGYAEFVLGDGYVMPLICGYPFLAEDLDPNPNRPIAAIVKKYDRQSNGFRACDVILPSLRFNPHGADWQSKTVSTTPKKAVVTNALLASDSAQVAGVAEVEGGSLGNFARTNKKASSAEVLEDLKHAAPGFSSYAFRYCSKEKCFDASLQVPVKAHKDERFHIDYIGLFAFEVPVDDAMVVIQATTGAPTRLGFLTREQFVRTKVDWWIDNVPASYFSGASKAEIFNEELTTLSGMPARLHTFRSPTAYQLVITQLAAYMAPGVFVQIRCSSPEKVYADAQAMCQQVVHSLEVPEAKAEDIQEPDSNDP